VGALTLPAGGTVYLDANSIIDSVERIEPYRSLLRPLWHAAGPNSFRVVTSDLTLLEVLVRPIRTGNATLARGFRRLLQSSPDIRLLPISHSVLERAAKLRAAVALKTPDAIHAASALQHGCWPFSPTIRDSGASPAST
jgi:uncharacterized protein